ncbi:hypothetical protein DESA109040_20955 [Deinococcus saxicola]
MALALALTIPNSQASPVDLWNLLGKGDTALPAGDVVYRLKNAAGVSVNVGVNFGKLVDGGYTALELTAFKFNSDFTSEELQLFASNVIQISAACFNTDLSRGPAITAWILSNDAKEESMSYTAGARMARKSFGPLQLALEKRLNGKGHAVTVSLSRQGTPGQAPWIKSCLTSG